MKVMFRLHVNPDAVPALKTALLNLDDTQALARALDDALVFEGLAGTVVEKLDGLAFEELARVIVDAIK